MNVNIGRTCTQIVKIIIRIMEHGINYSKMQLHFSVTKKQKTRGTIIRRIGPLL